MMIKSKTVQKSWRLSLLTVCCFGMTGCFSDNDQPSAPPVVVEPPPPPVVVIPDPSALRDAQFGDLPEGLEEANHGAFEGGLTSTHHDITDRNSVPETQQRISLAGSFNIPTNGAPSPMFNAEEYTQQMLRFEEFGATALDMTKEAAPENWANMPAPADSQSSPNGTALEGFLNQEIWPMPTRESNVVDMNPWKTSIQDFLGREVVSPPAEGRPPGEGWAHQRWDEFTPENYFQTATTGGRVNGGFRDAKQGHGYTSGEFGEGGLYHNTTGNNGFQGTTGGITIQFHPNMPVQQPDTLWTFDGTFPPKLLKVRYGEPVMMRHYNALPVDVSSNRGFGIHTLTTHEHNGHTPAESDGYANAFFFPGQFYDYRWPIPLAGHDSINTDASDIRAGAPDGAGGITKVRGDWRETMSSHWFHDHMLDFTAQNVYKGSVAMMNYYSALDRGNESIDDGVNLRMPSGSGLDWGNRDYDMNILLSEKAWDSDGQLWFNPFNIDGFLGDVMTVNFLYKPYVDVRARRYRFRLLNGSVSRLFKVALVDEEGKPVPFHMIANDGNIMEHTVLFENGELPTQGIAERYDIIIDFSKFAAGKRLYFVNTLQHKSGKGADKAIPLADIISGAYKAVATDDNNDGVADRWVGGDPVVGKFLEFRVQAHTAVDNSLNPVDYVAGRKKMIPIRRPTQEELDGALHRTFEFERQPTDNKPWVVETDGGKGFGMDPRRLSAAPQKSSDGLEVWRIVNSGTWSHPVHIHFEEGIILRRDGVEPPEWERWARKDVYRIGPMPDSGKVVEIALRFREFAGTYMEHCHNTQHEDNAMLLRWDIENPGQTKMMPTPIPSWDGVTYVDTVALPTARTGDGTGQWGPVMDPLFKWLDNAVVTELDNIRDEPIGDAIDEMPNERGVITIPLTKGINIDSEGNSTEVFFVLHGISDETLADEMGIIWAGALAPTPVAATSPATFVDGQWTLHGDLPNPITARINNPEGIPPQTTTNDYTSLRKVTINGKDVVINAFFVSWGELPWEHLRIDQSCNSFPDFPANTSCTYNGNAWGDYNQSGHAVAIDTTSEVPTVSMKLHKAWSEGGDYLPYYIVVDAWPAGPANNMGVIAVNKHEHLGSVAVPLVQFVPPEPMRPSYPPTPADGFGLAGGGPFGGQIGIPSYFMPAQDYSPMWHVGFAHWLEPATEVVKSLDRLKELRAAGKLEIVEVPPPPNMGSNNYSFDTLNAVHVVNCPTPITLDGTIHAVRNSLK
ncbi:MAG: FtsP/CotA-like multicopper oxidase with cupredoxin domain [Alteromonadaceae bacterium]|jgi:FtsP/CotA-like multicopper oxidase with cupredoxin domain